LVIETKNMKKIPIKFLKPSRNYIIAPNSLSSHPPWDSSAAQVSGKIWKFLLQNLQRNPNILLSLNSQEHSRGASLFCRQAGKLAQPILFNRHSLTSRSAVDSMERCKLKPPSHLFMQLSSCPVDIPKQMCKCPQTIKL
jgi:hypothetical protein